MSEQGLVERLRVFAGCGFPIAGEAATRIEALERERDEAHAALRDCNQRIAQAWEAARTPAQES